jgi:hypothetical protein
VVIVIYLFTLKLSCLYALRGLRGRVVNIEDIIHSDDDTKWCTDIGSRHVSCVLRFPTSGVVFVLLFVELG